MKFIIIIIIIIIIRQDTAHSFWRRDYVSRIQRLNQTATLRACEDAVCITLWDPVRWQWTHGHDLERHRSQGNEQVKLWTAECVSHKEDCSLPVRLMKKPQYLAWFANLLFSVAFNIQHQLTSVLCFLLQSNQRCIEFTSGCGFIILPQTLQVCLQF